MQLIPFFSEVFSGPEWLRIIISLFLLAFSHQVVVKYDLPYFSGMRQIPFILIFRELIAIVYFTPSIYFVTDAIVLAIYFHWASNYVNRRTYVFTNLVLTLVGTIGMVAFYEVFSRPDVLALAINIFLAVMLASYFYVINDITTNNSQVAGFISRNRALIFLAMVVVRFLMIFDPHLSDVLAQYILLPLSMIPPLYIVFEYDLFFYTQQVESEEFNSQYLNSLFDFMQTIGSAMNERIEVRAVLDYVMQAIVQYTDADAGVVMLKDEGGNNLSIACKEGYFPPPFEVPKIVATKISSIESYFEHNPIALGTAIMGEVALKNEPIFIRNTVEDGRLKANIKDNALFISSLIAVPLIVNNEVFGVVSVIRRSPRKLFSDLDYERSKVFVDYASLTLDSLYNYTQLMEKQEIEREVSIAGEIQKKLLPSRLPRRIRDMIAAWSQPAKGVSGDYYDIITLNRSGKLAIIICDVAGKGVPASLIMVMIRTITHLIAGSTSDSSKVVRWINRGIAGHIDIERFATLSYLTYDPNTREIEYSNAAHHPLVILRTANGEIEKLDSAGLPIGLERDAVYERKTTFLNPGDTIMLYTDGIVEAMNPEGVQYEEERLQHVLKTNANSPAKVILKEIRADMDHFVGSARQHDDQTLIVMKA